jgi:hypothetical protein
LRRKRSETEQVLYQFNPKSDPIHTRTKSGTSVAVEEVEDKAMLRDRGRPEPDVDSWNFEDDFGNDENLPVKSDRENPIPIPDDPLLIEEAPYRGGISTGDVDDSPKRIT